MRKSVFRKIAVGLGGLMLLAMPGDAQTPGALAALETGMWQLRSIGGSGPQATRNVCVRNAAQLLQLRHGSRGCPSRTLSQSATDVSVRYECSGNGWGQTSIHVETPRLARIDTQGIHGGSPFHQVYEARRTGACG